MKNGTQRYTCKKCKRRFSENTGIKEESQEMGIIPNSVKHGWMKTKNASFFFTNPGYNDPRFKLEEIIESINKMVIPKKFPKIKYEIKANGILEIDMADLHYGKLGWGEETGENYDFKIAAKRFDTMLDETLAKAEPFGYHKILFIIGHDFFNADSQEDATSNGTKVDSDLRWQKRYKSGCKIIINGISRLREKAPVHVMVIPGNHDGATMFYAGCVLEEVFSNTPDVVIDNRPKTRKYFYEDGILLGFSHGDKEKAIDLFAHLANEAPKYTDCYGCFDSAIVKEFHLGHFHHEIAKDYKGVVARWVKSPSGTDSWHAGKGFVGSVKGIQSFLYNKDEGLQCIFHTNVKYGG